MAIDEQILEEAVAYFGNSKDAITAMTSSKKEFVKIVKAQNVLSTILENKGIVTKYFLDNKSISLSKEDILHAMIKNQFIEDINSPLSKFKIWRFLNNQHQTNYTEGFYFEKSENSPNEYKLFYDFDFAGLGPG